MKIAFSTLLILLLIACNTSGDKTPESNHNDSVVLTSDKISAERENVNPLPVKTYSETIKNFETTDEFKVGLYETKQTFNYLIKITYKQMKVEDTLHVPNFGIQPSVEIVKGNSVRPSCIVGFFDKVQKLRQSKIISFADDKLKVKVLKYYGVYQSNDK